MSAWTQVRSNNSMNTEVKVRVVVRPRSKSTPGPEDPSVMPSEFPADTHTDGRSSKT